MTFTAQYEKRWLMGQSLSPMDSISSTKDYEMKVFDQQPMMLMSDSYQRLFSILEKARNGKISGWSGVTVEYWVEYYHRTE